MLSMSTMIPYAVHGGQTDNETGRDTEMNRVEMKNKGRSGYGP